MKGNALLYITLLLTPFMMIMMFPPKFNPITIINLFNNTNLTDNETRDGNNLPQFWFFTNEDIWLDAPLPPDNPTWNTSKITYNNDSVTLIAIQPSPVLESQNYSFNLIKNQRLIFKFAFNVSTSQVGNYEY